MTQHSHDDTIPLAAVAPAPEFLDAFLAAKGKGCTNHFALLFRGERADHTVPLGSVAHSTLNVFQPRQHTGLTDNLED